MPRSGEAAADVAKSPELSLAVECCRRSFRTAARKQPPLPLEAVDWRKFIQLIAFHRVEGLAWNALSTRAESIPECAREALAQAATAIAANDLRAKAACRQFLEEFEAEELPVLFLKGVTLGALAYGNAALKAAIDIDLLIDPADLRTAAELLRAGGYRLIAPRDSAGDTVLRSWHGRWKESVWSHDAMPLQIDLHTRVADSASLLPAVDVHARQQIVDVGSGIRLPTLAPDELFAYLAVHGASSAWFRLKWISDLAALLAPEGAERMDRLYRRSQELGAGRAAGQALLLADRLFGTLVGNPELRDELRRDRMTHRLYMAALRLLTRAPREPTEIRFGTLPIHLSQFLLLPGARYKMSEILRQANRLRVRGSS